MLELTLPTVVACHHPGLCSHGSWQGSGGINDYVYAIDSDHPWMELTSWLNDHTSLSIAILLISHFNTWKSDLIHMAE